IEKSISSVLNQTYKDFELIIIDDGSTDNTKEIVNRFEDHRIRYIYQTNQERSAARNNGIKNAKGKFICFLDSDDGYYEQHLEKLYTAISENNFQQALYYTGIEIIKEDQGIVKHPLNIENLHPVLY